MKNINTNNNIDDVDDDADDDNDYERISPDSWTFFGTLRVNYLLMDNRSRLNTCFPYPVCDGYNTHVCVGTKIYVYVTQQLLLFDSRVVM